MTLAPLNVVGDVGRHRGDGWCKDRLSGEQLALHMVQPGVVQELCRRRSGRSWRRDSRMSLASPSRVSHFLLLSRGLSIIAPACRRTSSGEAYACWQHYFCPCCKLQPCSEAFRAGARDSIKHSRHLHLETKNTTLQLIQSIGRTHV